MSNNGTREVSLNPVAAQLLAGEAQAANAAGQRFQAALLMALAHTDNPAGEFVRMDFKADGSAIVVVTVLNGTNGRATDTLTER